MENWIWIALGLGALALFAFRGGGCGMGHGRHDHGREGGRREPDRQGSVPPAASSSGEKLATGGPTADVASAEHAGHSSRSDTQPHRHSC